MTDDLLYCYFYLSFLVNEWFFGSHHNWLMCKYTYNKEVIEINILNSKPKSPFGLQCYPASWIFFYENIMNTFLHPHILIPCKIHWTSNISNEKKRSIKQNSALAVFYIYNILYSRSENNRAPCINLRNQIMFKQQEKLMKIFENIVSPKWHSPRKIRRLTAIERNQFNIKYIFYRGQC